MADLYTEHTKHMILDISCNMCEQLPFCGWSRVYNYRGCNDFQRITAQEINTKKGGNIMGYSNKAKAADANADKVNDKNFITINDISIDRANEIKDGVVMFDMTVGHIKIYGMSMRHMTNKDGQEWDAISFPARKAENGKYYDIAWFPMSAELKAQVSEKVIAKLNA